MDYTRRLLKGKKYSQDELIPFLILIIHSFGGTAKKSEVDDKMYEILHSEFSKGVYHETVANNVERWRHDIAWAKERAKQRHDFVKSAKEAGWGTWALAQDGDKYAKQLIKQIKASTEVIRRKKRNLTHSL